MENEVEELEKVSERLGAVIGDISSDYRSKNESLNRIELMLYQLYGPMPLREVKIDEPTTTIEPADQSINGEFEVLLKNSDQNSYNEVPLDEISKHDVLTDDNRLNEGVLVIVDTVKNGEEIVQMEAHSELVLTKESLNLSAPQLFDKMLDSQKCIEHKLLDELIEFSPNNDAINQDELEPRGPTLLMSRLQDNLKIFEEVCFDPGGVNGLHGAAYFSSPCTSMKSSDRADVIKSNLLITHGENNVSDENLDELKVRSATPWAVWFEDGVIKEVKKPSQHLSTIKSTSIQAAKDPCLVKVIFDPGVGSLILVDSLQENGSLWSINEAMTEVIQSLKVIKSDKENGNYNKFFELLHPLISHVGRASHHLDHLMKNIALDDFQSRVEMLALLLGRNFDPGLKSLIDASERSDMVFDPGGEAYVPSNELPFSSFKLYDPGGSDNLNICHCSKAIMCYYVQPVVLLQVVEFESKQVHGNLAFKVDHLMCSSKGCFQVDGFQLKSPNYNSTANTEVMRKYCRMSCKFLRDIAYSELQLIASVCKANFVVGLSLFVLESANTDKVTTIATEIVFCSYPESQTCHRDHINYFLLSAKEIDQIRVLAATNIFCLVKRSIMVFIFDPGGNFSRLTVVAQLAKFQVLFMAYNCSTTNAVICALMLSCKSHYILISRAFLLILEDKDFSTPEEYYRNIRVKPRLSTSFMLNPVLLAG